MKFARTRLGVCGHTRDKQTFAYMYMYVDARSSNWHAAEHLEGRVMPPQKPVIADDDKLFGDGDTDSYSDDDDGDADNDDSGNGSDADCWQR
ncbi:unnamed protein product [Enterobius vermicularis]|uniref:Retrotransposon protein n=1 Tax=Enterobius vermicularis TaxID=51028 RepID=A0A0N4V7T9_ENTVE|nr:unnamed protein product [Enterobius vermicularis]